MRAFTDHPSAVGETYTEHMQAAFSFAGEMFIAAVCCFLHGLFPFLFVKTGSQCIDKLHRKMVTHRDRRTAAATLAPAE